MSHIEIQTQIKKEYDKIRSTTANRLVEEYEKERKKLRIKKDSTYMKEYAIKTSGKNNWIIFLHKAPSIKKYIHRGCTMVCCVVYYYNQQGLRVFCPKVEGGLEVYNGHFFKRYNSVGIVLRSNFAVSRRSAEAFTGGRDWFRLK